MGALPSMAATPGRRTAGAAARALHAADVESERTAAVIRLAIFASILTAVLVAQSAGFDHRPLVTATVAYGVGTIAALVLAWRRIFRPWLPFAFVAMDVMTLAVAIHLLGRVLDLPDGVAATLPVGGLVIVVLLHASMHHRPALVAFGAAAFALCFGAASWLPTPPVLAASVRAGAGDHLGHFRLFPVAIFVMTAAILVLTTHRTRRFIDDAFASASRAATLSRYFSPQVVETLTSRPESAASFGERMRIAVIFADLRGFTAMAEAMDPSELARFLSEFRTRIAAPAIALGGVVDKYIGDAIMVVFGAPTSAPDDAKRALACAIGMADAIDAWSLERVKRGEGALVVGIGAHYGSAFAGVLSDGRLLEYTVIGDTVNVASRLAHAMRAPRTQLLVSAELAEAAGGLPEPATWTEWRDQPLPGHPRPVTLFQRLGPLPGAR